MTTRSIYQQDSYNFTRYLQRIEFFDDALNPMDLRGCTILVTYKPALVAVADDATDTTAAIKHELQISLAGEAVVSTGLSLESAATDGVVIERLTSAETTDMPIDTLLTGDLQLTDANGEILTWVFTETLKTVPAATNRAPS